MGFHWQDNHGIPYFQNMLSMKCSTYNTKITINQRHTLLYNSYSGNFIIIKNKISNQVDLNNIKNERKDYKLYLQLYEAGFFVDDDTNEIENLKKKIKDAENNETEFILHINPTLDCNFNCWYCYENHIEKSIMPPEVLEAVKSFITSKLRNNRQIKFFELGFFGGEPLLYFSKVAKNIIQFAAEECNKSNVKFFVHFTSNGSLLSKSILSFLKDYECGFQITLDGDKEHHNKTRFHKNGKGSFNTIINNIITLARNKIEVIARINYTSDNIESTLSILSYFSSLEDELKRYIRFDFQRVWQDIDNRRDEAEAIVSSIRKAFRNEGFTVLANYIPHNACDLCYGDKINHILINYDGLVFGCTARDFTADNSIGKLEKDGSIVFDSTKVEKRNKSKFLKPICHTCRIAPLCGGGCKQRASESSNFQSCTMGYTESDKDDIILDIFDYFFCNEKGT